MKRLAVFFLVLGFGLPWAARAEFFRWTDSAGEQHYTNDKGAIPAQYLASAETVETMPLPAEPSPALPDAPPQAAEPPAPPVQSDDWSKEVARGINEKLGQTGHAPLTPEETAQLETLRERWVGTVLASLAVSLLTWLGLVIHAFATGRIGWGIASLIIPFIVPPVYAIVHVGGKRDDPDFRLAPKVFLPVLFFLFAIMFFLAVGDAYTWINHVAQARGINLEQEFAPPPPTPAP